MSTDTQSIPPVDEPVDQADETEVDSGGYWPPAITIVKHQSIGDAEESIRVEIQDVQDFPTTGDLTVVLESVLYGLAGTRNPDRQDLSFQITPLPPEQSLKLAEAISAAMRRREAAPPATAEQLEEELHRVEEHDAACGQDHTGWLNHLRDLILTARSDKATADAGKPIAVPPTGDDLGDAVQAAQGQDGGNA